ncbi:Hypothetical protein A7982_07277 [Minicystis rosea]|nr:Hypothetical protein A7982_07277 [Minicystis rosea]
MGQTEDAMTVLNACATGLNPNATTDISNPGDADEYERAAGFINSICPIVDPTNSRASTYVDFSVNTFIPATYKFSAIAVWDAVDNQADCQALTMKMRLQKRTNLGDFVDTNTTNPTQVRHGDWSWDPEKFRYTCTVPLGVVER